MAMTNPAGIEQLWVNLFHLNAACLRACVLSGAVIH